MLLLSKRSTVLQFTVLFIPTVPQERKANLQKRLTLCNWFLILSVFPCLRITRRTALNIQMRQLLLSDIMLRFALIIAADKNSFCGSIYSLYIIRKRIEVVITGLTRNHVRIWVVAPPKTAEKPWFCWGFARLMIFLTAYLTGFLKNWIMIVSLVFEGEHIRRDIEVVITALTRNQVYRNVPRVRIPLSPPKRG